MTTRIHANNFSTTINGAITNVATTVVLTSVTGFPSIGAGVTCNLTLQAGSTIEIVTATARSTNTLTITRAAEGTSAVAWANGASISIRPTADSVDRKTDTLSGDVTTPGSGSGVATIASGSITLAKMANLAANSFIGNNTGSSATPLALSYTQTKTALSLNNVENTALSTWAGSTAITTLGTISSGTWNGAAVVVTYGGSGRASATAYAPILGGTTSTGAHQSMASAGAIGQIVQSGGSSGVATWSTPTYPSSSGTSGKFLISDGTNNVYSTSTIPTSAGSTALKHLKSDGTNYVLTTTTFPDTGTSRKLVVGNGTNYVESTETWAVPGSQYNMLQSDGTNWTAVASTGTGTPVLATSPTITTPKIAMINDTNGASLCRFLTAASAVNYFTISNNITGGNPGISATSLTDTNVNFSVSSQNTGFVQIVTQAATLPFKILSGTSFQHVTTFNMSNTAATRAVTFPDADGTLCYDTGSTNIATLGTITTGTWTGTTIAPANGGHMTMSAASGTTQAAAVNNGYICTNASQCNVTLPATAAVGDFVKVVSQGAAGIKVTANTSQTIKGLGQTTTSAGSVTPAAQYDAIQVVCVVANTTWVVDTFTSSLLTFA